MDVQKAIWSVGGGKGGIGKSITTANIGVALAQRGKSVILVDADLGGANLHIYFGIKFPQRNLDDFLRGRCASLEEAAIPTPVPGLRLISGASELLGIANPAYAQKVKLINHIRKLNADYILVDLGAGSSYNVLDFFSISNEGIVVLVPEPAAMQNAYVFLKSFVYRKINRLFSDNPAISHLITEATDVRGSKSARTFSDLCEMISREDRQSAEAALAEIKRFKPKLLLNMVMSKEDLVVVEGFQNAAKTFLSVDAQFVGAIYSRIAIKNAARRMRLFMLDESAGDARRDVEEIVSTLLNGVQRAPVVKNEPVAAPKATTDKKVSAEVQQAFGFNDNISHRGKVFHIQTEVLGVAEPVIETIVYFGGRIFFSKKSKWSDLVSTQDQKIDIREFANKQHRTAIAAIKMNKIVPQDLEK